MENDDEEEFIQWHRINDGGIIFYDPSIAGEIVCKNETCSHYRMSLETDQMAHCDMRLNILTICVLEKSLNIRTQIDCPVYMFSTESYCPTIYVSQW